ncbi:MAG: hypothetical protein A3I14_17715 [Candidatus Rokubacteria bacterium RIFCSPLOWO2_02_FULL_73_56]|nr:MAG: hypothetical protein A3D33_11895 [Candidatus Rokubacteria bacterium RIFCSPHIGHO2_02_FULL_73_26]OGL09490.1 MAG: hypothetical protein A3I14_17715 [Candidatus Rokubacteria bacterium RIFCSPLOWO2_02_FULL_73_56]OGL21664.1 MAG: hypothetical protein A3G44_01430 [Candidatus Rokubacteria bacterium RIFCSPLOWO2_12_FULL_73_47]
MKARTLIAAGAVLLLAGTTPALAQMRGPGSGTSGMTGSMPGMPAGAGECHGEPVAFGDERPWVSIALAHAKDLGLTPEQEKALTTLRDGFQQDALRLAGEIRAAEVELRRLRTQKPVDLGAVEARIRAIAGLEGDLRLARARTLEKGGAVLTAEQQAKLASLARSARGMHRT